MTARPINLRGWEVRAFLEGRKTRITRVLTPQPDELFEGQIPHQLWISCGDVLWGRETWRADDYDPDNDARTIYAADAPSDVRAGTKGVIRWRSNTHMTRVRSRITLIVDSVKVCRVQDITEAEADAECFAGAFPGEVLPDLFPGGRSQWAHLSIPQCFARLWNADHGPSAWEANPWVAAYTVRISND